MNTQVVIIQGEFNYKLIIHKRVDGDRNHKGWFHNPCLLTSKGWERDQVLLKKKIHIGKTASSIRVMKTARGSLPGSKFLDPVHIPLIFCQDSLLVKSNHSPEDKKIYFCNPYSLGFWGQWTGWRKGSEDKTININVTESLSN